MLNRLLLGVAFAAIAVTTYGLVRSTVNQAVTTQATAAAVDPPAAVGWTCPMHPDILEGGPGHCPICGMALVKLASGETASHADQVHVSKTQQQRIGLLLETLELQDLSSAQQLPGVVLADERASVMLSPKVEGWVHRLAVSSLGQPIKKGQILFEIYSPDLQQRQREYLDLLTRRDALQKSSSGMEAVGNAAPEAMLASVARERFRARARLAAADVPEEVLLALEQDRRVRELIPVRAERDGLLTALNVREGAYLSPAQPALSYGAQTASAVELSLTAQQLGGLRGDERITLHSTLDRSHGVVTRLDKRLAVFDPATRLARLRVPLPAESSQRDFPPGSTVQAELSHRASATLSVPRDAVLRHGDGDFVVVADGDNHFRPVPVTLGAEGEERVEVRAGLQAGQQIVINGQFLIGTEASWQAARTRQSAQTGQPAQGAHHHDH